MVARSVLISEDSTTEPVKFTVLSSDHLTISWRVVVYGTFSGAVDSGHG